MPIDDAMETIGPSPEEKPNVKYSCPELKTDKQINKFFFGYIRRLVKRSKILEKDPERLADFKKYVSYFRFSENMQITMNLFHIDDFLSLIKYKNEEIYNLIMKTDIQRDLPQEVSFWNDLDTVPDYLKHYGITNYFSDFKEVSNHVYLMGNELHLFLESKEIFCIYNQHSREYRGQKGFYLVQDGNKYVHKLQLPKKENIISFVEETKIHDVSKLLQEIYDLHDELGSKDGKAMSSLYSRLKKVYPQLTHDYKEEI